MEEYFKIKAGKQTKLKGAISPATVDSYLSKGFAVSHVISKGTKTKIKTWSPLTREQSEKQQRWR